MCEQRSLFSERPEVEGLMKIIQHGFLNCDARATVQTHNSATASSLGLKPKLVLCMSISCMYIFSYIHMHIYAYFYP